MKVRKRRKARPIKRSIPRRKRPRIKISPRDRAALRSLRLRLKRRARATKRAKVAERRIAMSPEKREKLALQTKLNTWFREEAADLIAIRYQRIERKVRGKIVVYFRERGKSRSRLLAQSTIRRSLAQRTYWKRIHWIVEQMGGDIRAGRSAYRAMRQLEMLSELEIES